MADSGSTTLDHSEPINPPAESTSSSPKELPTRLLVVQICLGILYGFRPIEPFLVPYFIEHSMTMDDLNNVVFPVGGYSNLAFLCILAFLSIITSNKVLLGLGWVGYFGCYLSMVFVNGVVVGIIIEVFYGLSLASETVYFVILYAFAPELVFGKVATISRATLLASHALSEVVGQLFVSFIPGFNMLVLAIITAVSTIGSIIPIILMPKVKVSRSHITCDAYRKDLCKVWGGGFARCPSLYAGIVLLSAHTMYQNYITNLLYDLTDTEPLNGVFILLGRLSGVVGSVIAMFLPRLKRLDLFILLSLPVLGIIAVLPLFVTQQWQLFILNAIEFFWAELAIAGMFTQLALSCNGELYLALFLCQAILVSGFVMLVQGTLFGPLEPKIPGLSSNRSHHLWLGVFCALGTIATIPPTVISLKSQP
ncbi:Reduced folate carrier [Giardia muris]|uniref:Reduced folate carrier n=1 Tax=Giardia muris TaxID=5742 RepID=A0A4Z1SN75_GIAMU|nr:Reduced folate carrier [Giardia muris]|eukprot:TNJ26295.1 Reduced folate carrier [Giardia muris]